MTIPTGTRLGPYEISDLVGTGGMGEVYRARDTRLGREVAIKVLPARTVADRDRLARFEKEARLASALNHPNIVTIYDIGESDSVPYIAMELVAGRTLRQLVNAGPMPVSQVVDIAAQIADGLAKAHDAGIVHRDLKPENVMITNDGFVKILDFGLGKFRPGDLALPVTASTIHQSLDITERGVILGTVDYMSPEHAAGAGEVDFRSDQFTLGSLLYEMTTGQRPFRRGTAVQTMSAIIADPPEPLTALMPAVPPALREIIGRCLEKSPDQRYPSTRDIVTELRGLSALIQLQVAGEVPYETRTKTRWRSAAAAALLIAGVLILGLLWRNAAALEPLPNPKNVVVLPFRPAGTDEATQAFSNGLTDSVTAALTQITTLPGLQVAPSSEVHRRPIANADDARLYVGANLVITGAVERIGESLRVAWNVIEIGTGRQLRTDSITVALASGAAIENETIAGILESLELNLTSVQRGALSAIDTRVASARQAFLQARGYLREFDKPENIARAISLFEEATKLDADYAQAYAGLGEAYWRRYENTNQSASIDTASIDTAEESCKKALHLDENLPAAHGCLATVHFGMGRYDEAIKGFRTALRSEPTNDDYRRELARAQERVGRIEDAEQTLREAIALRPHYWANYNVLGRFYFDRSRYAEAAEMFSRVIEVAPDNVFGYNNLGGVYNQMGRYSDAVPMLEQSVKIHPTAQAYSNLATVYFTKGQFLEAAATFEKATKLNDKNYAIWGNLADAYYWADGKRNHADREYRRAIALGEQALKINPRDAILLSRLASYHAMIGEKQAALEYLKRALEVAPNDAFVRFKAALVHNQFQETELTLRWLESAAQAGFSVTTIRDFKNFDRLWAHPKLQNFLRKY